MNVVATLLAMTTGIPGHPPGDFNLIRKPPATATVAGQVDQILAKLDAIERAIQSRTDPFQDKAPTRPQDASAAPRQTWSPRPAASPQTGNPAATEPKRTRMGHPATINGLPALDPDDPRLVPPQTTQGVPGRFTKSGHPAFINGIPVLEPGDEGWTPYEPASTYTKVQRSYPVPQYAYAPAASSYSSAPAHSYSDAYSYPPYRPPASYGRSSTYGGTFSGGCTTGG